MHLTKFTINFYEKLSFYNIPVSLIDLVMCAFDEFYLSITSKSFLTNPIKVDRGVLQGDSLPPLLFYLCICTLVNTVKNDKLNCFVYVYDFPFKPCNWFQSILMPTSFSTCQ